MPRKPDRDGAPDDVVPLQAMMPRWLKLRALERAEAQAKDLSEYIRSLILADWEKHEPRKKR